MIKEIFSKNMFGGQFKCYLLIVFLLSIGFAAPVWAQDFEEKYGKELKSISYADRITFEKEKGKPWAEATYDERYDYLENLDKQEMAQQMVEQREKYGKEREKMQRESARAAEKREKERKAYLKEREENDEKVQKEKKKYELQRKSMAQKRKLEQLRNNR